MMYPFPARSLVVSCQAQPETAMHGPDSMARIARAVADGGAAAIRANGPADVAAIRKAVDLPIIGINKIGDPRGVYITPTVEAAAQVVLAGASLVAIDGTRRDRPLGQTLAEQIAAIHSELGVPVMADVDTYEAGLAARAAGADLVATTLAGYTQPRAGDGAGPDLEVLTRLVSALDCPVVAEGRYWTPQHVRAAIDAGAYAVVVGTAITNPTAITARLRKAL